MSTRIVVLSAVAVGLLACVPPRSLEGFVQPDGGGITRAAFELQCPADQLQVVDLGGDAMGVTGCGKRAVYKWTYSGWVNNTGADQQASAR
jgi:hypothetical protein